MKEVTKGNEVRLTRREKEVLSWIADGLSTKQIADKLSISINTVANHRRNMLKKTGAKSSTELLQLCITKFLK